MRKVLFAAALLAGCYETPKPACAFLCGGGNSCPDGYACSTDDRCHLVESGGGLATCPDQLPIDAAGPVDSTAIDARPLDAMPLDAMPLDAMPLDAMPLDATPSCAPALAPVDDGTTAARQELLIAEIHPGAGGFIELYDNTASNIDLSTRTEQLVSDGVTVPMSVAGAGVTVLSHGETTIPWPAGFTTAADAGGELALYIDATTTDPTHMESFVCWGAAPTTSVKSDAETGGKWTSGGACPAALTASAIHRLAATQGLAATDFDVTSAPTPETCGP